MSKFGIRAMAQSLAREFGPKGVHVSHAIIDGIIDTEKTKGFAQDIPDAKIDPKWVRLIDSLVYPIHSLIPESRSQNRTGSCTPSPGLHSPMKSTLDLMWRRGKSKGTQRCSCSE